MRATHIGLRAPRWLPAVVAWPVVFGACDGGPPTFAADVAPIVHARCSSCHRPGGPGPVPLVTFDDVRSLGPQIVDALDEGRMPPWLPAEGDVALAGNRTLTAAEKRTIRRWVDRGMPSGELGTIEPPAFPDGWVLGEPALTLETTVPFPVPASGEDIFRNLVVPVPIEERRWVRGIEVRFTDPSVVHHAMITFDATSSSRRQDALDSLPGFDGMFGVTEAVGPSGFLLGWTPGREPTLSPEDLAFAIDPGTDLIVQLHLRPNGSQTPIGATLGVHTVDEPPARTPFTVRLGTESIDIPAGTGRYVKEDAYVLPVSVRVLGVYPHAHYVGREISLSAAIPGSAPLTILDIPDWDFNWQDAYRLAEPLRLPAGTTLEGRFVYDNSADNPRNPHRPPRRVVYGPRSEDEMGEIWVQVVPDTPEDLEALAVDFGRHNLRSKIEGWNHMLSIDPGEPTAHVGLGTVDAGEGRHADAIAHFRAALDTRPDYVVAHYNLGVSLERTGRPDGARQEFELVTRLDPTHAAAHNNLGILAAEAGRTDEAVAHFEAAVAAEPADPEMLNNLGNARRQSGDLDGAAGALVAALDLAPDYAGARLNLALVAWSRATDPDARVRDGAEAVRLAERAVGGAERDYRLLDILAAAYAEAGRFDEAAAAATRAAAYAEAAGADRDGIDARRELYAGGLPYRAR